MDMKDQVAVITGGAQGIGHAVARQLSAQGARVVSWDVDPDNERAMGDLSANALAIHCDIADHHSVQEAYTATCDQADTPVILVNSAGIAGPNALLEDYDLEAWQKVVDINLNGTFFTNRAVVPGMRSRGYGRIVNIASIAGKEGNPNASAYSASKAAVIGLTKSLGKELAGLDIAVNCVTPAAARTRIFDQMSQEHIDYMLSKIPRGPFPGSGRGGKNDRLAGFAGKFLHDRCRVRSVRWPGNLLKF